MLQSNDRANMVTAIEKVLSNEGWTQNTEAKLPEQIGWVPDRIFMRPNGEKLALEIEEEVNIPRFLVRIVQSNRELLTNTKVVVAAIRNTPLNIVTIRTGLQNDISIFADARNPIRILDSSFQQQISQVSPSTIRDAHARFGRKKRIPQVLIRELAGLTQIEYARELRQFAHDYESVTFSNWEDEHQFVSDFITDRFGTRLGADDLFEGLNSMSLLEEVSEVMLGKRPHFLHSFQTFLLGTTIIDKHYELFTNLYSAGFSSDEAINIDMPWFFASLLHDTAAPLERMEDLSPVCGLREPVSRGIFSAYSPHLLGCLFDNLKHGTIDLEWEPEPTSPPGKLYELLAKHRLRDHGVMGAFFLIQSGQRMNRRTLATTIYPAALAISVHNSLLWTELLDNELFPVTAKKFPLVFLLSLCDNIEEWGREKQFSETGETTPHVLINRLSFDSHIVSADLWIDEPARAVLIKNRYDWITQHLFSLEDLQISCKFSMSLTANENTN